MKGILSTTDLDDARLVAKAKASPGLVGRDLAREVMPRHATTWEPGLECPFARAPRDTACSTPRTTAGRTSSRSTSG